jgi:hypothetical protein
VNEDRLLGDVLELCGWLGLMVAHFRPARTTKGWRTPVAGDGKGFPDCVILGRGGVLWRELKSARGKVSVEQREWMDALRRAGQDVAVWRPADWPDRIRAELEALAKGKKLMPEPETTTIVRDYRTDEERRIAEQFPGDVAGHKLTVRHDDGLYRHLRCSNPGNSFYWFEIVTWPGSLAIRGDMGGGWIFSRIEDMFEFFRSHRSHGSRINPGYWAEKLPDSGRSVRVHSEQVLRVRLDEALAEYERDVYPELEAAHRRAVADAGHAPVPRAPMTPDAVGELVADYAEDDRLRFEEGARELLAELERADVVGETWEWNLSDWDWPFLWACHAIVWAISEYDRGAGT